MFWHDLSPVHGHVESMTAILWCPMFIKRKVPWQSVGRYLKKKTSPCIIKSNLWSTGGKCQAVELHYPELLSVPTFPRFSKSKWVGKPNQPHYPGPLGLGCEGSQAGSTTSHPFISMRSKELWSPGMLGYKKIEAGVNFNWSLLIGKLVSR